MIKDALPTQSEGERDGERVCRSRMPTADRRVFDIAKWNFELPIKRFSDQIESLDFTKPPKLNLSNTAIDELVSRSESLTLPKIIASSLEQPLDEQYLRYVKDQYTRVRQMRPAISSLFETARALLALEDGDSELAERLLAETIKDLSGPSVVEPAPRRLITGPLTSPSCASHRASRALSSTAEEQETSESSPPLQDRRMFYQRPCSIPASDQVWEFARSILTEALRNRAYSKRGERVAGSVKDNIGFVETSDMTKVS